MKKIIIWVFVILLIVSIISTVSARSWPVYTNKLSLGEIEEGWERLNTEKVRWGAQVQFEEAVSNFRTEVIIEDRKRNTLWDSLSAMRGRMIGGYLCPYLWRGYML